MRIAVILHPKWGGPDIHLGAAHKTVEAAREYVAGEVCTRCNRVSYREIDDDVVWVSKNVGFVPRRAA